MDCSFCVCDHLSKRKKRAGIPFKRKRGEKRKKELKRNSLFFYFFRCCNSYFIFNKEATPRMKSSPLLYSQTPNNIYLEKKRKKKNPSNDDNSYIYHTKIKTIIWRKYWWLFTFIIWILKYYFQPCLSFRLFFFLFLLDLPFWFRFLVLFERGFREGRRFGALFAFLVVLVLWI